MEKAGAAQDLGNFYVSIAEGAQMPIGQVKWFSSQRGFGFILDECGQNIFVHFKVIQGNGFRRLHDGENVEYEAVEGPKGLTAVKVRRIDPLPTE